MDERPKADVRFEEPPPLRSRRYDWNAIADRLRQRPGEWATVFDRDRTSLATAIRIKGISALHPDRGFEVRTSNNIRMRDENDRELRLCTLHLRYNPEKVKN